MKKLQRAIPAILSAIILMTAFSCDESNADATLVESTGERVVIEANATEGSLKDAMDIFARQGGLEYGGSEGDYGFYITSVNGKEAGDGEFWAVYTTLGEYEGVVYSSADFGTYDYNDVNLNSASYGISGLPLVKGCLYIITLSKY